jgi:hypothetical protein
MDHLGTEAAPEEFESTRPHLGGAPLMMTRLPEPFCVGELVPRTRQVRRKPVK